MLFVASCKEVGRIDHIDDSAPAPMSLDASSVTVIPRAGAAVLRYKLPNDPNLLSVKAVYENSPGSVRQTEVSIYTDSLTVEGFNSTDTYTVKLYGVGRNGKLSAPVEVSVTPDTPPLLTAYRSLTLTAAYGGVRGKFDNPSGAELSVVLMADTANLGYPITLGTFFISNTVGQFNLVGLQARSYPFTIYLRDRYGNQSEMFNKSVTPLFEQMLPKRNFTKADYNNDGNYIATSCGSFNHWWDGQIGKDCAVCYRTGPAISFPATFTIRLGGAYSISRIVIHHIEGEAFSQITPRRFELYGSNYADPSPNINSNDWFLIGRWESFKPSGPGLQVTNEDAEYGVIKGESFEVDPVAFTSARKPAAIIRLRVLELWNTTSATGQLGLSEIDVFGQ